MDQFDKALTSAVWFTASTTRLHIPCDLCHSLDMTIWTVDTWGNTDQKELQATCPAKASDISDRDRIEIGWTLYLHVALYRRTTAPSTDRYSLLAYTGLTRTAFPDGILLEHMIGHTNRQTHSYTDTPDRGKGGQTDRDRQRQSLSIFTAIE